MGFEITFIPGSQELEISQFIQKHVFAKNDFIVNSSGSTGNPKSFKFSYFNAKISAEKTIKFFNIDDTKSIYVCLDINTIATKMSIFRAYFANCKLICGPVQSFPFFENTSINFDFISLVPLQVSKILSTNKNLLDNSTVLLGGAKPSKKTIDLIQKNGINAFETYGMTETLSHVALKYLKDKNTIFQALDGIRFSLDNRSCLNISYPELLSEKIITNDIVDLIDEQSFIWKGRFDFIINSGGKKIIPEMIEQKISENLRREVVLTKVEDQFLGEKLVLLIEGEEIEVSKDIFSEFHKYQIPKLYAFVDEFERVNSKIKRISINNASNYEWREVL